MTKAQFGELLARKLTGTHDIVQLSRWAYGVYLENSRELEPGLREIILDIARMEDSPQFELRLDELSDLAGQLMRGTRNPREAQ